MAQIQGIRQKSTAGTVNNVHPCTLFTCEICATQISFLRGTTAIHGGIDTLRIFSSGMDAAGYIRSDVSTNSKLAAKSVQGCTLLARRRSRCAVYFKRTEKLFAVYAIIRYNGLSDTSENFNFLAVSII